MSDEQGSRNGGGIFKKKAAFEPVVIHFRLKQWFPELSDRQVEMFRLLHGKLIERNDALGLVGSKTIPQGDLIHFADSIISSRMIQKSIGDAAVADLASGGGFPGLIYAIMFPNSQVTLVEADAQKAEYLTQAVNTLRLSNTKVLSIQMEKLGDGSINYAMCRGFSTLSKTILVLRRVVKKGGCVFHLKGEEWFKEMSDIPTQLCSFWRASLVGEYTLPVGEVTYAVVKTDKIGE